MPKWKVHTLLRLRNVTWRTPRFPLKGNVISAAYKRRNMEYATFIRLFLLPTFVFFCRISTEYTNRRERSEAFEFDNLTGPLHNLSVRPSKCNKNRTNVFNPCYYDHACYKIFFDCCPDYEKSCGRQASLEHDNTTASAWKCVEFEWSPSWPCGGFTGVTGVWMIQKCADGSTSELKTKCENVSAKFEFSYPVGDFVPVVGSNNITYRNKHCALCNGVRDYDMWNVSVHTTVMPPNGWSLDSALQFIERNGGIIYPIVPRKEQPRRHCYGRNYIDSCNFTTDPSYKVCMDGPVQVVNTYSEPFYFKNYGCATCNGYNGSTTMNIGIWCDNSVSLGFSMVFNLRSGETPTTTVVKQNCPGGMVYDANLKFCREGHVASSGSKPTYDFLVHIWFEESGGRTETTSKLKTYLEPALTTKFLLLNIQISRLVLYKHNDNILVASFRFTLTPYQSLIMANQQKRDINATRKNTAFLQLLNFTGNFSMTWKEKDFFVVKVTAKRLSCYGEEKFQPHEYKMDIGNGTLVLNKTGEIYFLKDYTLVSNNGGNITLCRKLVLPDCKEGVYVPLSRNEYTIFHNLSVYHHASKRVFNFGEYLLEESLNHGMSNISNKNTTLSRNSTIEICLPFEGTFKVTKTTSRKKGASYGAGIMTSIAFSISITCLILLLITYGLFEQLRTLPGKNLMNLCLSLLLSQLVWLIGTAHFQRTMVCEIFAILEHYLILASFGAMTVISYHSCRVFAQPLVGGMAHRSHGKFIKYSLFVWLIPAVFVAVCVSLDKTGVFLVDYGRNCWLGTANATLYLFLLPVAVLLMYNMCTFILTAVSLSRHESERISLQGGEKQNLLICTKLATLMGFPWFFAFFGVMFPDVEALEYLFVVFVCFQGLYIGMAFLFNKKTLKLYKDRWNAGSYSSGISGPHRPFTFEHNVTHM